VTKALASIIAGRPGTEYIRPRIQFPFEDTSSAEVKPKIGR